MTKPLSSDMAGFTLVETLIAVFALALLMGGAATMVLSALRGQTELTERAERLAALDVMSAHLRSDLESAVPRLVDPGRAGLGLRSLYGGEDGRDGVVLGLVRNGWSNFDQVETRGELLVVEYVFEDDRFIRRVAQRPDRARTTPEFETELLNNVEDLSIRFFAGGQPAELWSNAVVNGQPAMPDVVELVLSFPPDEQLTQRFLVGGRR